MPTPLPNDKQSAVVTGGSGGVGAAIVRALHRAGYRTIIADIDEAAATALAHKLDASGQTALAFRLDISKPEDFRDVLKQTIEHWGSVEVLVNNAAVTRAQPVLEIETSEFNEILATNAGGTFSGCKFFGSYFKERGYGRIINMASLAGQHGGTATGAHYAASKGAILTLTKVFARDLGGFGVTVNAISPGPLDTPMVRAIVGEVGLDAAIAAIPVRKLGDPGFIADMVVMLASRRSAFVNGACWDANGGLFMR